MIEEWVEEIKGVTTESPDIQTRPGFTWPHFTLPTLPPGAITELILNLLESMDFGMCWWLSAMDSVNWNFLQLFQGFPSQHEMEDYFLNKAQDEGVTVISSKLGNQE